MCGFVAIIAPDNPPHREQIIRYGRELAHRGPNDEGVYLESGVGLGLVHRRLAILDVSPQGHQPMSSASGRHVVVYNGELYNHLDLRRQLKQESPDITFHGTSDTETLLAAIDQWGIERALQSFNGMFAFAVWDRKERKLYLARDRMGEKPLYVGWTGGGVICASELKPLLNGFSVRVDDDAMALMLGLGHVPAPRSILRGVFKLPPAHYLCLQPEDARRPLTAETFLTRIRCYWSPENECWTSAPSANPEDTLRKLDTLFTDSVRSRMLSDVPLGACLSGGIDSSLVVARMQLHSGTPVKTFTVGFEEATHDESEHARRVAAYLGTDHTEIRLPASAALELIPQLPQIYDEPFADSSQLPTLLLSRALRTHVTVALSGDGGDELFYGYRRYRQARQLWPLYSGLPRAVRRLLAKGLTLSAHGNLRLLRWSQRLAAPNFDVFYLSFLSMLLKPDALWRDAPALWAHLPAVPASVSNPDAYMMWRDQTLYLPDDILVKVDRASMSVGLEMRAPMLDHRLVSFARSLPMESQYHNGQGKWVLRQLLRQHLPSELFERPKQGFAIPVHDWLRGPLRAWAEDLLSPSTLSLLPHLKIQPVRRIWQHHCRGNVDAGYLLWNILMLMAWIRQWRPSIS